MMGDSLVCAPTRRSLCSRIVFLSFIFLSSLFTSTLANPLLQDTDPLSIESFTETLDNTIETGTIEFAQLETVSDDVDEFQLASAVSFREGDWENGPPSCPTNYKPLCCYGHLKWDKTVDLCRTHEWSRDDPKCKDTDRHFCCADHDALWFKGHECRGAYERSKPAKEPEPDQQRQRTSRKRPAYCRVRGDSSGAKKGVPRLRLRDEFGATSESQHKNLNVREECD